MTAGPHEPAVTRQQSCDWEIPADVPRDIIVKVDGVSFALHKFPLLSRSGLLRKLVLEENEEIVSAVELEGVPGGAEGFELAAKFCHGAYLEMSKSNISLLRCVAEFLQMSGQGNLICRAETSLEHCIKHSNLKDIITILNTCEKLLPMAEDLRIVERCIEQAASKATQEAKWSDSHLSLVPLHDQYGSSNISIRNWWAEDLSLLCIEFYQRVLTAMRARGLETEVVGSALVYYAHRSLKGMTKQTSGLWDPAMSNLVKAHDGTVKMKHEQRMCALDMTLACKLDLEKRIGAQLHRATLDDLLIPSAGTCNGEPLFDVDMVHRLFSSFLEHKDQEDGYGGLQDMAEDKNEAFDSPSQHPILMIGRLLDAYLMEIASDGNLTSSKFKELAEVLPEYARPVEDGLYRAIDMFFKAHPSLTDVERKKLCRLLNFQKLSQEACMHAAQNERLPLQAVVQVLYLEQLRIRNAIAGCHPRNNGTDDTVNMDTYSHCTKQSTPNIEVPATPVLCRFNGGGRTPVAADHYASVRRENRELKLEVTRIKMRLSDLEKDHQNMKQGIMESRTHLSISNQHHHSSFFRAFSKSVSKLNPFHLHHKLNGVTNHQLHLNHRHQSLSQPQRQRRAAAASVSSSSSITRQNASLFDLKP